MIHQKKIFKLEHKEKNVWKTQKRTLETYRVWEQILNIHVIIVPEGEKVKNGVGTVFEDIMTNTFPKTDEHQATELKCAMNPKQNKY